MPDVRDRARAGYDWLNDMLRGDQTPVKRTPAATIQGGNGVVQNSEALIDTTKPVPTRKYSARDAQTVIMGELVGAVRELYQSTTALSSQINRGGAKNGVLGVSTALIGSSGAAEISRPVTIGSILISNPGANPMTVQIGPGRGDKAPNHGQGLFPVPAGQVIPVPIGAKTFVVYGTVGDVAGLQIFTGMHPYGVL